MFSISIQNFNSSDDDHKELSLWKETDFKTKSSNLSLWLVTKAKTCKGEGLEWSSRITFYVSRV